MGCFCVGCNEMAQDWVKGYSGHNKNKVPHSGKLPAHLKNSQFLKKSLPLGSYQFFHQTICITHSRLSVPVSCIRI